MITSKLILDIFDLAFDNYEFGSILKKQTQFLLIRNIHYTSSGVFIHFNNDEKINAFEELNKEANFYSNDLEVLDGIELKNEVLNILADVIIHIKNGIISYLEICNKNGEDYPTFEPEHYELYQLWVSHANRKIVR